jgi:hypothetical protein
LSLKKVAKVLKQKLILVDLKNCDQLLIGEKLTPIRIRKKKRKNKNLI